MTRKITMYEYLVFCNLLMLLNKLKVKQPIEIFLSVTGNVFKVKYNESVRRYTV